LMERLAWHQLRLKPAEAQILGGNLPGVIDQETGTVDQWVQPLDIVAPPTYSGTDPIRDAPFIHSRLAELLTGPRRPYVLAFGGMLIMFSLVLNPNPSRDDDDEMVDIRLHYADAD